MSGTLASRASTTAGARFTAAVPEVQVIATGRRVALAIPGGTNPAERSSITDTQSSPGCPASVRISGALREPGGVTACRRPQRTGAWREPGEATACRRPQRTSSSTSAWSGAKVRLIGIIEAVDPLVAFLPGFAQRGDAWQPVAERVAQSYRSVCVDFGSFAFDQRLSEIASRVDDGDVLVGYSMGGRLALRAALRRPPKFGALVLVGASPGIEDAGERLARKRADEELADWIEQHSIEDFA